MKIVYGVTCMKSESLNIFKNNIQLLKKEFEDTKFILNTNHNIEINGVTVVNCVGNMRESRVRLHELMKQQSGDVWMVFDSDIELTLESIKQFKEQYLDLKNKYDFISMYYKKDSPMPAFYTLSSSLTDFYFYKIGKLGRVSQPFDDSCFEFDSYQIPTNKIIGGNFKDVLRGISFGREIGEFTNVVDEKDTTTGGASIYFKKIILEKEYKWKSKDGKSLTWYDSYRTFRLIKDGYRYAKVPIFVNHNRHYKSIQLSWEAVDRYIKGLNLYMSHKDEMWNKSRIILHTQELSLYSMGMIKKIRQLKKLTKDELDTVREIEKFLMGKKGEIIWK